MNLNDYTIYLNYARNELNSNNEASFIAYRIALQLAPKNQRNEVQSEYNNFISHSSIDETILERTCIDLILERVNNGEYKESLAVLTSLIFDSNPYLQHLFFVKYNLLLYILLETSVCELNSGISECNISINQYESLDDFYQSYYRLKFMIRNIWFHVDISDSLSHLNALLLNQQLSPYLLATMIKYTVKPPYYEIVFTDISNYLAKHNNKKDVFLLQYFADWLCNIIPQKSDLVFKEEQIQSSELIPEYIDAKNSPTSDNKSDIHKIAFIICSNNQLYIDELMQYLKRLIIPTGFKFQVLVVQNASCMAQGYNAGMHATNAKYKIYIHQDTFILNVNILIEIINAFQQDNTIGLIGIAGSTYLPDTGIWWDAPQECHRSCIIQDNYIDVSTDIHNDPHLVDSVRDVKALDGIFLATSQDIEWRSDLFNGWHFYDISQCYEFLNKGFRVVYYNSRTPLVLHELSAHSCNDPEYEKYRNIFCSTYLSSK